jgi:hypothetical protein
LKVSPILPQTIEEKVLEKIQIEETSNDAPLVKKSFKK